MRPRQVSVYPPLNPAVLVRRAGRPLPFPLEKPGSRLYLQARQGLWSGLKGLGLGAGDELLAPAYHHGSEIEALVRTRARCRFYDGQGTFEPDEAELEALLGPRVRALYLIHQLGFAQDCARWRRWCDERGLLLIEDGAQGWLSVRDGHPIGASADLALFCLYKAFGLPDGGAVLSRSFAGPPPDHGGIGARGMANRLVDWTAQRSRLSVRLLRDDRRRPQEDERPEVDFALPAVDQRSQRTTRLLLSRVVDASAPDRRRANFARLAKRLAHVRSPAFAAMPPESSPLAFPIEVDDKRAIVDRLAERGVLDTRLWMVPHPVLDAAAHPRSVGLRNRLIGLPVHQELRTADVDRIADVAADALGADHSRVGRSRVR